MKYILFLLVATLLIAGCSQDGNIAESVPATIQPEETADQQALTSTDEPTSVPLEPTVVTEPATPTTLPTTEPTTEVLEEPSPGTIEAVVTETPAGGDINGSYENTYFRGSETAPVTLIDYSDFL